MGTEVIDKGDKQTDVKEVTDATKGELGGFLETLTASLKTELDTKLGKDNPRTDEILNKVSDLQKVGMGLHIRSAVNTVMGFFGFAKKFKPDLQIPGGIEEFSAKASKIADQVDELKDKFNPDKMFAQMAGGTDQQALLAQMGINTGSVSSDAGVDLAFQDFETKAESLKKQTNITVALYEIGYAQLLKNFIDKVKGGTEPDKKDEKTPTTKQENKVADEKKEYETYGMIGEYDDVKVKADDNLDDLKDVFTKDMLPVSDIKSDIFRRNPETGVTLCARTAWENLKNLGVEGAPLANAFDVKEMYGKKYLVGQELINGGAKIVSIQDTLPKNLNDLKGNVFDIFLPAKGAKYKQYGHRLVGFRSEPSNQIYMLDPYTIKENGYSSRKPMKIEEFIKQRGDIVKIVGYDSKKKAVDSQAVIAQMDQKRNETKAAA